MKPIITTWGATNSEVSLAMAGDHKTQTITSIRVIEINSSKADVWKWLIQLGADRGGFYSYYFIEKSLGYRTRHQDVIKPEFKEMVVGDFVRGSVDEKKSIIPYNFRVLYVNPGETFVLENWGTFLLKEVNPQQTRLIIRTQEAKSSNPWVKIGNYITVPLHFIMERRTLIGIKECVEAGDNLQFSQKGDIFWFLAIVLSGVFIFIFVLFGRGFIRSFFIPCIFSSLWLITLFLLSPIPIYSIGLLLVMCVTLFILQTRLKN